MPFFVVVRMHARPGRLTDVLTLIQREFDRSQAQGSGRRRGRLFQRLGDPTDLLGVVEWDSETSYAAYRTTTTHQAILDSLSGPSHARYCRRLTLWERMYQQAAVTACALIDGDPSGSDEIASFLTRMGRAEMLSSPGIISHEVYRTRKQPASYIVVHQWKRLADLEAFRAEVSPRHETVLNDFGATIERFTGRLAASSPVE